MKFLEHLNCAHLDFIAHFDISHDALLWQRARHNNMIHLRSLDSDKHAGSLCERPGYKEATRALVRLQYAQGQRVPYIPVKSKTRQNSTLDLELKKKFRTAKFSLGGVLRETANFRTPTTIIILKLVTKPSMVEFVILGPKFARIALPRAARERTVGKKVRTTMTDARPGWHEREGLHCCPSQLEF